MTDANTGFTRFLSELNHHYQQLHTTKEDAFWALYMGLTDDAAQARATFQKHELELQSWLQDPQRLQLLQEKLAAAETARIDQSAGAATEEELIALKGWVTTFQSHAIESAEARTRAAHIMELEGNLASARNNMKLGWQSDDGEFNETSSVALSVMLQGEREPSVRKAVWQGLRSIETCVLENGFPELVKQRNQLGRMLGGTDFYDATVRRVEGLTKLEIFALLDELEEKTRDAGRRAVDTLAAEHGSDAITPWNVRYFISGDITREEEPYFSFAQSLERWGKSFAALGIDYNNAEMVLDLVDRKGKHENGFMHGPVPAWRDRGQYRPAKIQFTANAIPGMTGSGRRATETLFHEGGHAAHFANIDMPAPCFAQEFAPTSVAFAEVQSMFLDSLVKDADWQTRYATNADGDAMPFELMEKAISARQPFAAWRIRMMLTVCYAERAIYEIPDEKLTPENILTAIRAVESRLLFLDEGSPRPVLSVPHLLSGESSAYYHGYVLAELAVEQTRDFFLRRDGHLVDNPKIGPDLTTAYWRPGNARRFLEYIEALTGAPLTADHLAGSVNRSIDTALEEAQASIANLVNVPVHDQPVNLNANIRVMHGNQRVAGGDGKSFAETASEFAAWIQSMEQQ